MERAANDECERVTRGRKSCTFRVVAEEAFAGAMLITFYSGSIYKNRQSVQGKPPLSLGFRYRRLRPPHVLTSRYNRDKVKRGSASSCGNDRHVDASEIPQRVPRYKSHTYTLVLLTDAYTPPASSCTHASNGSASYSRSTAMRFLASISVCSPRYASSALLVLWGLTLRDTSACIPDTFRGSQIAIAFVLASSSRAIGEDLD